MANVNDFVLVSSYVFTMLFFFAGLALAVNWGCYWWHKYCAAATRKNARRVETMKMRFAMERRTRRR